MHHPCHGCFEALHTLAHTSLVRGSPDDQNAGMLHMEAAGPVGGRGANETAKPKRSGVERPVALKQTWASPARLLGSSPRKRGPITTVFGYGSRLSARFAGVRRDDALSARPQRARTHIEFIS